MRDRVPRSLARLAGIVDVGAAHRDADHHARGVQPCRVVHRRADGVEARRQIVERIDEHGDARGGEFGRHAPSFRTPADHHLHLLLLREFDGATDVDRTVDIEHDLSATLQELEQHLPTRG